MSNSSTKCCLKLGFQQLDERRDKWLIHGTKRHGDNQLLSMELPYDREYKSNTKEVYGNKFNAISLKHVLGQKHPREVGNYRNRNTKL